jgi:hypothetical protein
MPTANVMVDRTTVEDGTRLLYHYSIPNVVNGQYDLDLADRRIEKAKHEACRDRMTRRAVDCGAQFRYAYRDGNGVSLFVIEIDRTGCADLS